jgi:hypothetical protein
MNEVEQYFAEINADDVVINIHVVTQKFLDDNPDRYPGMYIETFTDVPSKTYAGIGYLYDRVNDNFVLPVYVAPTVKK